MQPMSVASWFNAISVAMEQCTVQYRASVVEAYFKNSGSAVTAQHNRYFAETLTSLVMAVLPVITPYKNGYRTFGKMLRP